MSAPFRRAIVIVMDSVGIGELPDAAAYGDQGSNTVGNIAKQIPLRVPTLRGLGLNRLVQLERPQHRRREPVGHDGYGRRTHWALPRNRDRPGRLATAR